jgi:protein phosphatase 1A
VVSDVDMEFFAKYKHYGLDTGSTGCAVIIAGDNIICFNVGDSRAILCRDGKPVLLSLDHKPSNPEEKKRIEDAGGSIIGKYVNGKIAVTRAFGDFRYKLASRSIINN